jgi:LuxR family maltose regulon positive regulatory protein
VVPRPRLYQRLAAASGVRLITIVAPAGWDKTTLLAAWVRELDPSQAVAWLTLNEADSEPVRFRTYLPRFAPIPRSEAALGGETTA